MIIDITKLSKMNDKGRGLSFPRGRGPVLGTLITLVVTVGPYIVRLLPVPAPQPQQPTEPRFRVVPPPIIIGPREI